MKKTEIIERVQEAYDYLNQDPWDWMMEHLEVKHMSDFFPYACGYVSGILSQILWDNDCEEKHKED